MNTSTDEQQAVSALQGAIAELERCLEEHTVAFTKLREDVLSINSGNGEGQLNFLQERLGDDRIESARLGFEERPATIPGTIILGLPKIGDYLTETKFVNTLSVDDYIGLKPQQKKTLTGDIQQCADAWNKLKEALDNALQTSLPPLGASSPPPSNQNTSAAPTAPHSIHDIRVAAANLLHTVPTGSGPKLNTEINAWLTTFVTHLGEVQRFLGHGDRSIDSSTDRGMVLEIAHDWERALKMLPDSGPAQPGDPVQQNALLLIQAEALLSSVFALLEKAMTQDDVLGARA